MRCRRGFGQVIPARQGDIGPLTACAIGKPFRELHRAQAETGPENEPKATFSGLKLIKTLDAVFAWVLRSGWRSMR